MSRVISLDFETSAIPIFHPWQTGAYPVAIGITDEWGFRKQWVLNHDELDGTINQRLVIDQVQAEIDTAYRMVGQNLKFDLNWLRKLNIDFSKVKLYCTKIADYFINGQDKRLHYDLNSICARHGVELKLDRVKTFWDAGYETRQIPLDVLLPYLERDCQCVMEVYHKQSVIINRLKVGKILAVHNELQRNLSEIECNGMFVDKDRIEKLIIELTEELRDTDEQLKTALGWEVNLNSGDELSAALFGGYLHEAGEEVYVTTKNIVYKEPYVFTYADGRTAEKTRNRTLPGLVCKTRKCTNKIEIKGVGFKPIKGTELKKGGYYSTSKDVISQLSGRTSAQKHIVELLLTRSRVAKALSSFISKDDDGIKGLINKIQADGCVHPQYNQTIAATGRLSSKDPNGQNFPRAKTSPIKHIFVPRHDFIVSADLSQLEWRVAGVLSQDPVIMREVLDGIDAHLDNAVNFFGDAKFRQDAKIFIFRMIYGGSAYAFYMDTKMPNFTLKRWEDIVKQFYTKYRVLKEWQDRNIDTVLRTGMLRNPSGRIYYFDTQLPEKVLINKIKNYPVQGFATADIMPLAMVIIDRRLKEIGVRSLNIGQIHDSLLFDCLKDEVRTIGGVCLDVYRNLPKYIKTIWGFDFNLPMDGEIEAGKSYRDMVKYKSEVFLT